MPSDPADVFELLKLMRMDATQLQARITDLGRMVAALDLPKPTRYPCTECIGGLDFGSQAQLREHLVNVHDWEQLGLGAEEPEQPSLLLGNGSGEPEPTREERRRIARELRESFLGKIDTADEQAPIEAPDASWVSEEAEEPDAPADWEAS